MCVCLCVCVCVCVGAHPHACPPPQHFPQPCLPWDSCGAMCHAHAVRCIMTCRIRVLPRMSNRCFPVGGLVVSSHLPKNRNLNLASHILVCKDSWTHPLGSSTRNLDRVCARGITLFIRLHGVFGTYVKLMASCETISKPGQISFTRWSRYTPGPRDWKRINVLITGLCVS
jgi:hypothetical protein